MITNPIIRSLILTVPTSAWDVLEHIISIVEAEPKRLDMNHPGPAVPGAAYNGLPECGTVCCFGGWGKIVLMLDDSAWLEDVATLIGGLYRKSLFKTVFYNQALIEAAAINKGRRAGTPEHVRESLAVLRAWMAEHKGYLKARMVRPGEYRLP